MNKNLSKMMKILFIVVSLLALFYSVDSGTYEQVTHYQYVVDWTPTFCKYPARGDVCRPGLPDIFVMHGIWPAGSDGQPVPDCPAKNKFLSNDLMKRFQATLTITWPSIMQAISTFAFWGHEYKVHGICFEKWTGLDYLSFHNRVSGNNNITKTLETNGIKTSAVIRYSKTAIENAIRTKIGQGLNIYLNCWRVDESLYYLKEVAICIKKMEDTTYLSNYEFQSCPVVPADSLRINCGGNRPEEKNIMLLPASK